MIFFALKISRGGVCCMAAALLFDIVIACLLHEGAQFKVS